MEEVRNENWNVDIDTDQVVGNLRFQSNAPQHIIGPPHAFPRAQWPVGAVIAVLESTHNDQQFTIVGNDWRSGCYLTVDPPPTTEEWELDTSISVLRNDLPPQAPPVNVDVPHVLQDSDTLTCTMGNWEGEPTAYEYQWIRDDDTVIGTGASYLVTPDDIGTTVVCIVTASNAAGATEAPPSNGVVVA